MRTFLKPATLTLSLLLASAPLTACKNDDSGTPNAQNAPAQNASGQNASNQNAGNQNPSANIAPASAGNETGATTKWSNDQLLTCTVHQAWLLSGRNEATFFEMVTQLADISARNRDLQLPENEAAGREVGEMIKKAAKADTDQLLYAVVDAAVRKVGKPLPASASETGQPAR